MKGCLAPSEIPGIASSEASLFGTFAENLIYADFCTQYSCGSGDVYLDDNNPATYLYFLASKNPHFTEQQQRDYFRRAWGQRLAKIPDFLVHSPTEKVLYEVKPDSTSGRAAGRTKIGTLKAVYTEFRLPYVLGRRYQPRNHRVAFYGTSLTVALNVRKAFDGLIVYKLCLESDKDLTVEVIAALLAMIVRLLNQQRTRRSFRPVDLQPVFASTPELKELAISLGLVFVTAAAATVGWKYFWKAVGKRFAARGATAAMLSAADGPLPVGELLAAGMGIWTVIDIIRLSDELWRDAGMIKLQET